MCVSPEIAMWNIDQNSRGGGCLERESEGGWVANFSLLCYSSP